MRKRSAERAFRAKYPGATIERQKLPLGGAYYLVRCVHGADLWAGCGNTIAQAWSDACARMGVAR